MEIKEKSLQQQIYESMDLKTTQELLEIWVANDRNAWTETAFATIKDILQNRNVEIPEQHIQNGDTGLEGDQATLSAETKSIAQAHFNQSCSLWKESRYQEALEQCDQALALAPGWSEAHNLRGVILEEMQQIDQSILEYRKAIRLNPRYKDARENLAYAKKWHPAFFEATEEPAGAASLPQDAAQESLIGLKCPECGGAVAATDTYCKHCGAYLAEPGPLKVRMEESYPLKRGFWITFFLIIWFVANLWEGFSNLRNLFSSQFNSPMIYLWLLFLSGLKVASVIALWNWKKWGAYAFPGALAIEIATLVIAGANPILLVFVLPGLALLIGLLVVLFRRVWKQMQ
jgi:tetratricopeptide (TPR) repeat protein